jgi:adenine-specific DNA methylase
VTSSDEETTVTSDDEDGTGVGDSREPAGATDRDRYPIERGFPVARVNDLVNRENRARLHYRPLSVLHKWWARQFGTLFRAVSLYTFLDDPSAVTVREPGTSDRAAVASEATAHDTDDPAAETDAPPTWDEERLAAAVDAVDLSSPETLWELYAEDVRVDDVAVLDPFVGAGTTLAEATRFGVSATGVDLNPVATFLTERTLAAHRVEASTLEAAFETVRESVATELRSHYRTACPTDDSHTADVVYGLWVRCLDCSSCGEQVRLFRDYRVASGRYDDSDRDVVYCPDCEHVFTTRSRTATTAVRPVGSSTHSSTRLPRGSRTTTICTPSSTTARTARTTAPTDRRTRGTARRLRRTASGSTPRRTRLRRPRNCPRISRRRTSPRVLSRRVHASTATICSRTASSSGRICSTRGNGTVSRPSCRQSTTSTTARPERTS